MAETVDMSGLEEKVRKVLKDYDDEAARATKECVRKVALAGARALRGVSPRRSGAYAADWTSKAEEKRLYSSSVVYNRKNYQVAHLLENPRKIINEYGYYGMSTPIRHIKPVEEQIIAQYYDSIIVGLTKGR